MNHRGEVTGNVAWLVTGGVLGKAARFAATVVVANAVGASGFGVLSTVLGVTFAAATLSDLGLSQLATRELSQSSERAPGPASTVLALKLVVMALVTAAGAVVALPASRRREAHCLRVTRPHRHARVAVRVAL